jgi:[acyl-carrier-protein] S-malonyltransferase
VLIVSFALPASPFVATASPPNVQMPRLPVPRLRSGRLLRKVRVAAPTCGARLFTGVDGVPVMQIEAGLDKLSAQILHTVERAACVQGCIEAGATVFLKLGPGSALSRMAVRRRARGPRTIGRRFRTVRGRCAWLGGRLAR